VGDDFIFVPNKRGMKSGGKKKRRRQGAANRDGETGAADDTGEGSDEAQGADQAARHPSPDYEDETPPHIPVMLEECMELLNLRPGKTYVDATAGAGGHMLRIAGGAGSDSTVYGIDRDVDAIARLRGLVPDNVKLIHSNYTSMKEELSKLGVNTIDGGILADLGVSSMQLDEAHRGFSFMKDGPLDMRMDQSRGPTAEELLNELSERELADIIFQYGEERYSRQIARSIVYQRPIKSTRQLSDLVSSTLRKSQKTIGRKGQYEVSKHPATRTFQAIRIAVNQELQCLEKFLDDAVSILAPGARLVVITFHSLEDRLVKQFLRRESTSCVCPPRQPLCTCNKTSQLLIITRKPVVATGEEVLANVRSRSAKIRAGEKLV